MVFKDMNKKIQTTKRPLDIFYLVDVSISMEKNLEAVNESMRAVGKLLVEESKKNPNVQLYIRIIKFGGDKAEWHLKKRTEIENFIYEDIKEVKGLTPFGDAISKLSLELNNGGMDERAIPPLIILLSDGSPNDEWDEPLDRFLASSWGEKASKIAIAIGNDPDHEMLRRFTKNEARVFKADESIDLKFLIRWTSTLVSSKINSGCKQDEIGSQFPDKYRLFKQGSMLTKESNSHL